MKFSAKLNVAFDGARETCKGGATTMSIINPSSLFKNSNNNAIRRESFQSLKESQNLKLAGFRI